MTNRLRTEIQEEEELEKELIVEEKPKTKDFSDNFIMQFLTRGVISTEQATRALPFIIYIAFLGMLYIANRHLSENNVRDIDKISKEVKELSWEYKSSKADLAFKSTLTEVAKRADTLGIREPNEPPQKITVKEDAE
ncbi:FtsL-like putative cell division protein [Mucilaginibacter litoreus]|uniref:FtsL-like putative cell division protein n=1 Tax=Mucilaginibacter litoreus TaxID=1048221 RepID=A0ABW3ANM5_9SPHI